MLDYVSVSSRFLSILLVGLHYWYSCLNIQQLESHFPTLEELNESV